MNLHAFSSAGTVRIPLSEERGVHPPPGQLLLPRGRVQVLPLFDPEVFRRHNGMKARLSFDGDLLSKDEDGKDLPAHVWKPTVCHIFHILKEIMTKLGEYGLEPVYCGKQEDDLIEIGLWKNPRNPPV